MPLEVFSCFKAASLTEEVGGLLAKNTNHVEEIKFHDQAALRNLLLEFGNKYERGLKQDEIMCKVEKDGSYSMVIIKQNHPATWHYSKKLEIMRFTRDMAITTDWVSHSLLCRLIFVINNGDRTEWSPILSVIIRVNDKIRFVNIRLNCTTQCPVTNKS